MWSHCYTHIWYNIISRPHEVIVILISGTTLFQGHVKSLLYSYIWYNTVSRPHEVIVILLYLVQHCFKAMWSHCYTHIWYNIVSRPCEVIVILLYLVQHCFKATWSHCYTLISGITLFQSHMKSLLYSYIWYNTVSRPCEVIVILLYLVQHCFKAMWSHCYTLISGAALFQGHMKSLLYSYIWYNTVSRPCEVIVILLYLVQHCFKAMWSHCYTHIWYNIVSRPCKVIVILLYLVQHCFKATWSDYNRTQLLQHCFKATWNHCYTVVSGTTFFCFCCFTSHVNSYVHCGTVSSLNHAFSWAGLSKRLTSNLCTYFRL